MSFTAIPGVAQPALCELGVGNIRKLTAAPGAAVLGLAKPALKLATPSSIFSPSGLTFLDTFQGTNGTAIGSHVPDVPGPGHGWFTPSYNDFLITLTGSGACKIGVGGGFASIRTNVTGQGITTPVTGIQWGGINAICTSIWNFNGNPSSDVQLVLQDDDLGIPDGALDVVVDMALNQFYFFEDNIGAHSAVPISLNLTTPFMIQVETLNWQQLANHRSPGNGAYTRARLTQGSVTKEIGMVATDRNPGLHEPYGPGWGIGFGLINAVASGETCSYFAISRPSVIFDRKDSRRAALFPHGAL